MSNIFYKFSSQKDFDTIQIETPSIQLGKLKALIIAQKKLKTTDFDLLVKNFQTKQDYKGDTTLIAKNTSLLIERVPTTQTTRIPGLGGSSHSSSTFIPGISKPTIENTIKKDDKGEDEKIKTLFNQSSNEPVEVFYDRFSQMSRNPPPSYICHRCNQPGHYIQNCPTNGNPTFDIAKVRKPTGIPKSFLKPTEDPSKGNLMMEGGGFATVLPNEGEFDRLVSREKPKVIPSGLQCPICKQLFNNAVLIPCCGSSYCDQCITKVLVEDTKMSCPGCKTKIESLDRLIPNKNLRDSVEDFRKGFEKTNKNIIVETVPLEVTKDPREEVKVEEKKEEKKEIKEEIKKEDKEEKKEEPKKEEVKKREDSREKSRHDDKKKRDRDHDYDRDSKYRKRDYSDDDDDDYYRRSSSSSRHRDDKYRSRSRDDSDSDDYYDKKYKSSSSRRRDYSDDSDYDRKYDRHRSHRDDKYSASSSKSSSSSSTSSTKYRDDRKKGSSSERRVELKKDDKK